MKISDYKQRGYASFHIKKETRSRFNLIRAKVADHKDCFVSQDDLLNMLMDRFADHVAVETQPGPQQ